MGSNWLSALGASPRYIKLACPVRTERREKLLNGKLVVNLIGEHAVDPDDLLAVAEQGSNVEVWLHLGHITLSPFTPGALQVEPCEPLPEHEPSTQRVYLRSVRAATWEKLLIPLAQCAEISCQWYELEETARPIADFCPGPLPVLCLRGYPDPVRFFLAALPAGLPRHEHQDQALQMGKQRMQTKIQWTQTNRKRRRSPRRRKTWRQKDYWSSYTMPTLTPTELGLLWTALIRWAPRQIRVRVPAVRHPQEVRSQPQVLRSPKRRAGSERNRGRQGSVR